MTISMNLRNRIMLGQTPCSFGVWLSRAVARWCHEVPVACAV